MRNVNDMFTNATHTKPRITQYARRTPHNKQQTTGNDIYNNNHTTKKKKKKTNTNHTQQH